MTSKKIFIKSYGCQMNVYDSNRLVNLFEPKGYSVTKNIENADLIVLNTCHIREKAAEKVYSDIGRINQIKRKDKNNYKLVISGCVAQAEGEEIKKRAPSVDYIVGPQSYHKLPLMIEEDDRYINDDFLQNEKFKNLIFKSSNSVSEFISIQEGCDKFCSFCVVPYTRGSEFSRSIEDIIAEINKYVSNGIKEIILLGQNVNAYHGKNQQGKQVDLAYLIDTISEIENIKRIRYMTSHPIDMNDSLIDVHGKNSKLMPFLHLPIQSGSDKILKKMNRKHTVNEYCEIINKLKMKRNDIAISSDFIVGFPGESKDDFEKTIDIVKKIKFTIAYSFMFSPRPGTPAFNMDDINLTEKKSRLKELQSLLKLQQKNYNNSFINKKMKVLYDRMGRHNNQYIGRSIYNQSVFVESKKNLKGKILDTHIIRSTDFALEGKIYEASN
tara:strand:+ start:153 stop:1472 length:1320 start_codon:yes stop_codon:yes gene_type:complete